MSLIFHGSHSTSLPSPFSSPAPFLFHCSLLSLSSFTLLLSVSFFCFLFPFFSCFAFPSLSFCPFLFTLSFFFIPFLPYLPLLISFPSYFSSFFSFFPSLSFLPFLSFQPVLFFLFFPPLSSPLFLSFPSAAVSGGSRSVTVYHWRTGQRRSLVKYGCCHGGLQTRPVHEARGAVKTGEEGRAKRGRVRGRQYQVSNSH